MHPDFGCGIHDYVFAPNNVRTAGLIRFHVEESLRRWEPRIDLQEVVAGAAPDDPAVILLSITYKVKATDSRFNMVYPFYLERGADR
jgi:phage baseplate assembly protein W